MPRKDIGLAGLRCGARPRSVDYPSDENVVRSNPEVIG